MIATYIGINQDPLPSFVGEPIDVKLKGDSEDIAKAVYEALGQFRVSVACVFSQVKEHYIINRYE
jgi:hypothetical protein